MRQSELMSEAPCVFSFQYRNRVSPHAAKDTAEGENAEEGFNTAIGYPPMRLLTAVGVGYSLGVSIPQ